jgi:hypothetical protein
MSSDTRWLAEDLVQSSIQKPDTVIGASNAHLLGQNIATVNGTTNGEEGGKICAHVEELCSAGLDLTDSRNAISGNIY